MEHNFELVRRLDVLLALGRPGRRSASRARARSASSLGDPDAKTGPLAASVAAAVAAYERGATILRVHDVREHVEALAVARAVDGAVITVELRGLSVFGRHGVHAHEERATARSSSSTSTLDVGDRGVSDRLEDAVDYRDVAVTCRRSPTRALRPARGARRRGRRRAACAASRAERVRVRVAKPAVRPAASTASRGVSVSRP